MRVKDQYDWIAIGENPGALLSAAIAAKAGFSVLIVPVSSGMESRVVKVAQGEQVFDPEPNSWLGAIHSEKQKGLVAELLTKLGALPQELEAWSGAGLDLVTPDFRLKLGGNAKQLGSEFKREVMAPSGLLGGLKAIEDPVLSHWGRSVARLTLRRGGDSSRAYADPSLRAFLRGIHKDHRGLDAEIKRWLTRASISDSRLAHPALLRGARYLWTGSDQVSGSPLHWLQLCALSRTLGTYKGGASAWREYLLKLAKRLGAEVAPRGEFKRIWVSRGRFSGIQLGSRSAILGARGAALGVSLTELRKKAYFSGWGNYRRVRAPLTPVGWRFTLSLTVHAEAIPPGLATRVVFQESDAPPLEVEISNPMDYGINDPEYRYLQVRTVLPYTDETLSSEYQRMTAGRMIRKLTEVFPFLEYHVIHLYPDFRISAAQREKLGLFAAQTQDSAQVGPVGELSQVYPMTRLQEIPESLLVYPENGLGSHSGIGHLFLVNDEAYPELGSLGPAWAALESTAWLAHKSGMNGPLS